MVKGVLDYTTASSDFYTVFDNMVGRNPQLNQSIEDVRKETNLFLVKVLRFYTHRDLAYVEELGTKKKYYCHLTHEMLSYEVSFNCMCDGNVESDTTYGTYVKPYSTIYGVVADVRFSGTVDKKCLLSCLNYDDNNQLKSDVRNGEIRIMSGDSSLSVTRERINITTPRLFVNGLPYDEPKLSNYYDKTEVNTIKSDTDAQIEELNGKIEGLDVDALSELINGIQETVANITEDLRDLDLSEYVKDDELESALDGKVDKVTGKGLSTNDFTTEYRNKLDGLHNYTHPNTHPSSIVTESSDLNKLGTSSGASQHDINLAINQKIGTSDFSGSYTDLSNKPTYTPTVYSTDFGAYEIGKINISGTNVSIYGKDTVGSGGGSVGDSLCVNDYYLDDATDEIVLSYCSDNCISEFDVDLNDIDNGLLYLNMCSGKLINNITKTSSGLVDTYTIHFSDDSTYQFNVTNGSAGSVSYIPTITQSDVGAYKIGELNGVSIYGKDTGGSGGSAVVGTGSFSINGNGHLVVELPDGVSNPYYIDNNGHLIYDTSV